MSTGDTCLPSMLAVGDALSLIASLMIVLERSEGSLGLLTNGKLRVVPVELVEVKEETEGGSRLLDSSILPELDLLFWDKRDCRDSGNFVGVDFPNVERFSVTSVAFSNSSGYDSETGCTAYSPLSLSS